MVFIALLYGIQASLSGNAQSPSMPREDVVDIPAVGDGLWVSNLFQSNMVLQRDQPISIWGWAEPGTQVQVVLQDTKMSTRVNQDRVWRVKLPARPASAEPLTIEISAAEHKVLLNNVLIGDVWVLGGQSNMEFPLDRIENGQLEIASANYEEIRVLTIPAANGPEPKSGFARLHEWSGWFNRHYRKGDWDVCSPEIARELSAIGYVFARRVHMASKVPIGVIDASRGGTTVETWTPIDVLASINTPQVNELLADWDLKIADWNPAADLERRVLGFNNKIAKLKKEGKPIPANEKIPTDLRPGPAMDQNRPGNCFASMITPLQGLQIKGVIFHQGYNNCFNGTQGAVMYRQVFPEMVRAWRQAFNNPNMPFGILSLCTEGTAQNLDNFCEMMANAGPYIREAQYQTFLDFYQSGDANIGFASTYDLRRRWYHPQLKIPAGERIARWALATQYQMERNVRWKPPMLKKMVAKDGKLLLEFDEAVGGVDDGGPITGFAIAGTDRKFHPADATHLTEKQQGSNRTVTKRHFLILKTPMVPAPVHYRYAWARNPLGNLQGDRNTDIPFATQRSDHWPMETTPLGVFGTNEPLKLERGQRRELQQALQAQDQDRLRFEAEQFLKSSLKN
ncbi:MAG: hypothetical protein CBE00_06545 [Planctomycetaceae bacterium TMED240]|nr:hypothetical protein [Rhodopirellula sp.]OUX06817.1 MAG: hypothetical protein CBE00_06545 [Planctomycetaceae bacterium TMED240]